MRFSLLLSLVLSISCATFAWSSDPTDPAKPSIEVELDRSTRQFRLRTYQVFRHNRSEYDRRRAWVESEVEKSKADGLTESEAKSLQSWMERVEATPPYPDAPLPAFPSSHDSIANVLESAPRSTLKIEPAPLLDSLSPPQIESSVRRVPPSIDWQRAGGVTDEDLNADRLPLRPNVPLPPRTSREATPPRWRTPQAVTSPDPTTGPKTVTIQSTRTWDRPETDMRATGTETESLPVNLGVLRAKIRSYNLSRAALENNLLDDPFSDVDTMDLVSKQLKELMADYQFVRLYYHSLTGAVRARLEPPVELTSLLQLAESRCLELQQGSLTVSEEQDRLATLAQRIHEWIFDLTQD